MKETTNLAKSVLELKSLYFDTIEFRRKENIVANPELNMNFSREVKQDAQNPNHFLLTLVNNITDKQKDEFVINLSLVG